MRRKCGLYHRDGRRNHLTAMLGALSAADVPSDRRHPRIPPFPASACTDIRVRRLCHPASLAVYYFDLVAYAVIVCVQNTLFHFIYFFINPHQDGTIKT